MKPLGKCLAAGSLAALALFGYYERTSVHSFFNASTKSTAINIEKKDVFTQSAKQLKQSAPLIAVIKPAHASPSQCAMANMTQQIATGKVNDDAAAEVDTVDYLTRASMPSYKHIVIKKEIDISKLTKRMSATSVSMYVKTGSQTADSIRINNSVATDNSPKAEQENNSIQPEKMEAEPAYSMPKKMAGTAYEGNLAAASVKLPGSTINTVAKSAVKGQKVNQKMAGANMTAAFASVSLVDNGADTYSYSSLSEGTEQLREFAERNGSNTDFGIIVNLGIKSGKKRFFVIDLSSNTIVKSGVVAEGSGDVYSAYEKRYSNEPGSMASSLGIYKIGKRAKAALSYQLFGLQESNSNAEKRSMVLQGSEEVPYDEINLPLLKTNGSLSISNRFLKEIGSLLNESAKPVLLWVYDPAADGQSLYSKNN